MTEGKRCQINLLDDRTLEFLVQPRLLAGDLLDIVASHFSLHEKEYFGLCFIDDSGNKNWLRLEKRVLDHDLPKGVSPIVLIFSVRFYCQSITLLKETKTIELFYFQARSLIFQGELESDSETVFLLAAYVLQATHGDYVSESIGKEDLKKLHVIPMRTLTEHPSLSFCEEKVITHYKRMSGLPRGEAIVNYLSIVERLPMYGVHYYDVKDKQNIPWKLGLSYKGIGQYDHGDKKIPRKIYMWGRMENLFYRDKKFSVEVRDLARSGSNHSINSVGRLSALRKSAGQNMNVVPWFCSNASVCREIWLMAVGQHQFYMNKRQMQRSLRQRTLKEIAKELSRSTTSLGSSLSSDISESNCDCNSIYNSVDGDPFTSLVPAGLIISPARKRRSLVNLDTVNQPREEVNKRHKTLRSSIMCSDIDSGTASADMISALQARKEVLEQLLLEKIQDLRNLCLREAEITGKVPEETPDGPEDAPSRRKVGTTFVFSESVLSSSGNGDEELERLQQDYEIQLQITNAAQRLSMDSTVSKKVRKARRMSYQKSLVKLKTMEQELEYIRKEQIYRDGNSYSLWSRSSSRDDLISTDSFGPFDPECSSRGSLDSVPKVVSQQWGKRQLSRNDNISDDFTPPDTPSIQVTDQIGENQSRTATYGNLGPTSNTFLRRSLSVNTRPSLKIRQRQDCLTTTDDNDIYDPDLSAAHQQYLLGEFGNSGIYSNLNNQRRFNPSLAGVILHSSSTSRLEEAPMDTYTNRKASSMDELERDYARTVSSDDTVSLQGRARSVTHTERYDDMQYEQDYVYYRNNSVPCSDTSSTSSQRQRSGSGSAIKNPMFSKPPLPPSSSNQPQSYLLSAAWSQLSQPSMEELVKQLLPPQNSEPPSYNSQYQRDDLIPPSRMNGPPPSYSSGGHRQHRNVLSPSRTNTPLMPYSEGNQGQYGGLVSPSRVNNPGWTSPYRRDDRLNEVDYVKPQDEADACNWRQPQSNEEKEIQWNENLVEETLV